MDTRRVYRCHYRAQLAAGDAAPGLRACEENARRLIAEGKLMTAALYHWGPQLFLYYEALGEPLPPESFMAPLHGLLTPWPQKDELHDWAQMYNVFWHVEPKNAEDWQRPVLPERRRGRIACLKHDKLFSYVYHHHAIAAEGKLTGDRYQSIALHEDMLFSYFEEPRTNTNNYGDSSLTSEAIQPWLDADPESHFIRLPGSSGNFLLLPEYFALGRE